MCYQRDQRYGSHKVRQDALKKLRSETKKDSWKLNSKHIYDGMPPTHIQTK